MISIMPRGPWSCLTSVVPRPLGSRAVEISISAFYARSIVRNYITLSLLSVLKQRCKKKQTTNKQKHHQQQNKARQPTIPTLWARAEFSASLDPSTEHHLVLCIIQLLSLLFSFQSCHGELTPSHCDLLLVGSVSLLQRPGWRPVRIICCQQ